MTVLFAPVAMPPAALLNRIPFCRFPVIVLAPLPEAADGTRRGIRDKITSTNRIVISTRVELDAVAEVPEFERTTGEHYGIPQDDVIIRRSVSVDPIIRVCGDDIPRCRRGRAEREATDCDDTRTDRVERCAR